MDCPAETCVTGRINSGSAFFIYCFKTFLAQKYLQYAIIESENK